MEEDAQAKVEYMGVKGEAMGTREGGTEGVSQGAVRAATVASKGAEDFEGVVGHRGSL